MPTQAGQNVPIDMLPAGPLNPVDWLSFGANEALGIQQQPLMRGTPGMAAWQRRQIKGPDTNVFGTYWLAHSRPYSRGAQAYAPQFGVLNYNPIGAGIYAPYKLPVIGGPGARYQFAAIWFDVQTIPTTVKASPTMSMDSLNALIMTSHVDAMYATTG